MFRKFLDGIILTACMFLVLGCSSLDSSRAATNSYSYKTAGSAQARVLAPGDGIEVSIEVDGRMEVLLHQAELNHAGIVTLPLVGDIKIGGMQLTAARDVIAKTYGAYYVNPPVVMLGLAGDDALGEWGSVTVLGRVNAPGQVPLSSQKGMNLSAAIQLAGGFAVSAKTSGIRVTRTDELGLSTRVTVDFDQIGKAGNSDADIVLSDGDIIYVPERIF